MVGAVNSHELKRSICNTLNMCVNREGQEECAILSAREHIMASKNDIFSALCQNLSLSQLLLHGSGLNDRFLISLQLDSSSVAIFFMKLVYVYTPLWYGWSNPITWLQKVTYLNSIDFGAEACKGIIKSFTFTSICYRERKPN